jgi:hypothetical protein
MRFPTFGYVVRPRHALFCPPCRANDHIFWITGNSTRRTDDVCELHTIHFIDGVTFDYHQNTEKMLD